MTIDKKLIERLYVQEGKSVKAVSEFIKKSPSQVSRYLKKHGIPTRPFSTKGLKPWLGKKHSEETKAILRKQKLGKKLSPNHRAKVIKTLRHGFREENPNWHGKAINGEGYVLIKAPYHPYARKSGYMFEHRLVMERYLKRFLNRGEEVHHLNGNKQDNRVENLIVLSAKEHAKLHNGDMEKRRRKSENMKIVRKNRFWSTRPNKVERKEK